MRIMAVIFAAIASAAHATPTADQFDLDCNAPSPKVGDAFAQAHARFRIDLAHNRWCEADCSSVHDIQEVQPTVIWLDRSTDQEDAIGQTHYRSLDRETGEYLYARTWPSTYGFAAMCQKLPFSGFPKFDTKF